MRRFETRRATGTLCLSVLLMLNLAATGAPSSECGTSIAHAISKQHLGKDLAEALPPISIKLYDLPGEGVEQSALILRCDDSEFHLPGTASLVAIDIGGWRGPGKDAIRVTIHCHGKQAMSKVFDKPRRAGYIPAKVTPGTKLQIRLWGQIDRMIEDDTDMAEFKWVGSEIYRGILVAAGFVDGGSIQFDFNGERRSLIEEALKAASGDVLQGLKECGMAPDKAQSICDRALSSIASLRSEEIVIRAFTWGAKDLTAAESPEEAAKIGLLLAARSYGNRVRGDIRKIAVRDKTIYFFPIQIQGRGEEYLVETFDKAGHSLYTAMFQSPQKPGIPLGVSILGGKQ